jgi:hypothetical protein
MGAFKCIEFKFLLETPNDVELGIFKFLTVEMLHLEDVLFLQVEGVNDYT